MNDKIVLGIILLVATILIGWVGGAICILAGLIISIILIAIGVAQPKKSDSHYDRHCPNCGRSIPFSAIICPYCSNDFKSHLKDDEVTEEVIYSSEYLEIPNDSNSIKQNVESKKSLKEIFCSECGRKIPFDSKVCPYCKHDFEED